MQDFFHIWNQDLMPGATGSYLSATGTDWGSTRVIRRLMTCPGDDPFNPEYGAGLSGKIGLERNADEIEGVVRKQMREEIAVDQTKPVKVTVFEDDNGGTFVTVAYADAQTGQALELEPIGPLNI